MVIRILAIVEGKVQLIVFFFPCIFCPSVSPFSLNERNKHERRFCFSFYSFPLLPSLYRIAAGDADDGGEVDLSVHADGAHAVDHPVLPDTAIQNAFMNTSRMTSQ